MVIRIFSKKNENVFQQSTQPIVGSREAGLRAPAPLVKTGILSCFVLLTYYRVVVSTTLLLI